MEVALGEMRGADGSCRLSEDGQATVAILQGPAGISHENEKMYRHVGHVHLHSTTFQQDESCVGDALLQQLLDQAIDLSQYPRTEINIHIDVKDVHSVALNVNSFNSASLCLMDAALRMHHYFGAVCVAELADVDTGAHSMVVNPPSRRLPQARSVFVFIFKPSLMSPVLIGSCAHGQFTFDQMEKALDLARSESLHTFDFIRQAISRKLSRGFAKT